MARAIEDLKQAMEVCELGALTLPDQVDALMDAARAILQEVSTLIPPNEPMTIDKKRVIAESCLHYSKSGRCGLNGYAPLDCPRCKEWQSSETNEPLTLEQLREMDGEPVWIVDIGCRKWYGPGWAIVDRENNIVRTAKNWNPVFFERYGESWLAYRRPPEGEKDTNFRYEGATQNIPLYLDMTQISAIFQEKIGAEEAT